MSILSLLLICFGIIVLAACMVYADPIEKLYARLRQKKMINEIETERSHVSTLKVRNPLTPKECLHGISSEVLSEELYRRCPRGIPVDATDDIVLYGQAIRLKAMGYNKPFTAYYKKGHVLCTQQEPIMSNDQQDVYAAPKVKEAFLWLITDYYTSIRTTVVNPSPSSVKEYLFTTVDGVEKFKGDSIWYVTRIGHLGERKNITKLDSLLNGAMYHSVQKAREHIDQLASVRNRNLKNK